MLPGITVDGAVYMNGQLCELQGQIVRETPIPAGDLSALKQFCRKRTAAAFFLKKDRMYANCVDSRMEVEQAKSAPPCRLCVTSPIWKTAAYIRSSPS